MSVAAVAIMASNAFAQGKANFAGTWNLVVDPNAAAAAGGGGGGGGGGRGGRGGGGGFGPTFTVVQDAKTLTITRTMGQNEVKSVYNLDGSESKNSAPGRGGAMMETVSKAKWDVDKIVIETPRRGQDGTVTTTTQTLELDSAGVLWVSTTRPGQDGAPMTTKVQYKKS